MVYHVIAMDNICKHYEPAPDMVVPVLKHVDLTIEPGEFVSIMGPSGSGKTTLMNIIGTLDRQSSGVYLLDNADTRDYDDEGLAAIRNNTLGFVFQGFNLLPRRSVLDNIALPLLYAGENKQECLRRAEHYLQMVGLSKHRDYLPTQLSGGQQQRIAIARALCGEPKVLLADEPTGNLDSATGKDIMDLFQKLNREGMTIILVTHDPEVSRAAKRLVQIKDGEVVYDGAMY